MPNQNLEAALRGFMTDWQNDLTPAWRGVLAGVSPAFDDIREDLLLRDDERIYPGRKGQLLPNAPQGAEVFRALARVAPSAVRAVVIGQDPYPRIERATGRAFEQGDVSSWTAPGAGIATSLKRLLQITAFHRTGDATFLVDGAGWQKVSAQLSSGALTIETPAKLFNRWEDQGVIFLNAALTISRYVEGGGPEQAYGHIPMWRPIIHRILQFLVGRTPGQVVFLTWGAYARRVLKSSGVDKLPGWGTRADAATYAHPATAAFLLPPNPFAKANEVLERLGGERIEW